PASPACPTRRSSDLTGDHQWIHVDAERAARESPFGGTVAHGFLTLSLLAPTGFEVLLTRIAPKSVVNYGLDTGEQHLEARGGERSEEHTSELQSLRH